MSVTTMLKPATWRAFACIQVEGLPSLRDQVRLFGQRVLSQLS